MRYATLKNRGLAPLPLPRYCRRLSPVSKLISCAFNDPHSTLGVHRNATDAEIKAAHRKRVKECHPDLASSRDGVSAEEAHVRFISIQQAYELLTGKSRGKEVDLDSRSSGWSFHDFYWSFKLRNRRKSAGESPHHAPPLESNPEVLRHQWKSQLQGLKQKAAARKYRHQATTTTTTTSQEEDEYSSNKEEGPVPPLNEQQPTPAADQEHHTINNSEEKESWSHIVSFFSDGETTATSAGTHAPKFANNKERVVRQFVGLRRRASMLKEVATKSS